jgi:hypothetical protein
VGVLPREAELLDEGVLGGTRESLDVEEESLGAIDLNLGLSPKPGKGSPIVGVEAESLLVDEASGGVVLRTGGSTVTVMGVVPVFPLGVPLPLGVCITTRVTPEGAEAPTELAGGLAVVLESAGDSTD